MGPNNAIHEYSDREFPGAMALGFPPVDLIRSMITSHMVENIEQRVRNAVEGTQQQNASLSDGSSMIYG
jgi:hypothetical protein